MKFNLFNSEWTLDKVDKIEGDNGNARYGECSSVDRKITIAENVNGYKVSKYDLELTKLHELVHAIFVTGNYCTCNADEPLVEWVANCLYSLKKQKVI